MRATGWTAAVAIAAMFGWQTHDRNRAYESFAVMARDIVRARPENAVARLFVAEQLIKETRGAEAEALLRTALAMPLPPGSTEHHHPLMRMYLGLARAQQEAYRDAVAELERAIAMKPTLAEAYVPLADTYQVMGRVPDAVGALDRGIAANPNRAELLSRVAWLRATAPDDAVRDGERAVRDAERAVALSEARDPMALSALAAAYAETDQFARALEAARRAQSAAAAQGNSGLVGMLQAHQAMYEQGQKMRTR
jgi:tetratricopeptide (TPR) repeat protein